MKALVIAFVLSASVLISCRESKPLANTTPAATPSTKPTVAAVFVYVSQVGIVDRAGADQACLTLANLSLPKGTPLIVVTFDEPQKIIHAQIADKFSKLCEFASETPKDKVTSYRIQVKDASPDDVAMSIGIVGFSGKLELRDGKVRADLNGNGVEDSFRSCASSEGIHLTVWNGEPLKSPLKWHDYHYLGYDVDADCTDADTPKQ